jgi:beta-glucosidase
MKKLFKILIIIIVVVLLVTVAAVAFYYFKKSSQSKANLQLLGEEAPTLTHDGITFRDLNKNGRLDIYENSEAAIDDRVRDLVSQMTLEEKAGAMFITMIGTTPDGEPMEMPVLSSDPINLMMSFMLPSNSELIVKKKMNSFNTLASLDAASMARYNNRVQKMAERMRLGIPITLGTDPRHGTENNPGAAIFTPAFSGWPSPLGLAATRDTTLVRSFGDIARQEYLAVGYRLALHPMADLATEPRWGRINGTFGEDADLSAAMTRAYILGFQGDSLGSSSVACMTKHFAGGGPQKDGEDAHFPYGKDQVYPGDYFSYHVRPFVEGAFPARTAQIMPYYGIPVDQTSENVAFAFNKDIIQTLLRDSLGFEGVVCTDWNIISDSQLGEGRAWGVEDLTPLERVKKALDAGCDQFGGEMAPELVVELVKSGQVEEARLDRSVSRIMRDKLILGLFENPYVDEQKAGEIAGNDAFRAQGIEAQKKSTVLLKNDGLLPLKVGTKIYVEDIKRTDEFAAYGQVVKSPAEADVIIKKLQTPFDERTDYFLESFFHQGRLYFTEEERKNIIALIEQKPSIVAINLERPAIITEIDAMANATIADFGADDAVMAALIFGKFNPTGKLPFELPSSQGAVEKQLTDVPYDSENPLYPFGHGLSYEE